MRYLLVEARDDECLNLTAGRVIASAKSVTALMESDPFQYELENDVIAEVVEKHAAATGRFGTADLRASGSADMERAIDRITLDAKSHYGISDVRRSYPGYAARLAADSALPPFPVLPPEAYAIDPVGPGIPAAGVFGSLLDECEPVVRGPGS